MARPWHLMQHQNPCRLRATGMGASTAAAACLDALVLTSTQWSLDHPSFAFPLVAALLWPQRPLSFVFCSVCRLCN